jgi:cysteine-S-conjugate beta-lyase
MRMSPTDGLNRRAFLKNAGLTALAGAVSTRASAPRAADAATLEAGTGKYDFDTPYNRFGTECVKYDQPIRTFGKDSIQVGMGIADMDFRAAPCIGKALADRCQHENWGYLDMPVSFTQSIIAWNKRRYGIDINPDLLALSNGVHPGIIAALKAFSPPGSRVLLLTPAYDGFYSDLTFCQVKPEECLMRQGADGRYSIDFDDFERRISHDTNTFILCNPHNPTGNMWSAEDLTRLGEICLRRRVVVLADEIHCDFANKGHKYTPFASLPNKDIVRNSITFKAASKSFSISAMKCAWFFSDNPDYFARVKAHNHTDVSTLSVIANRAALTEGEDWLNQCVEYVDGNHDFTESFIKANVPLVKYYKPQGTYLAWIDISQVADRIGAKRQAEEANRTNTTGKPVTAEQIVQKYLVTHAKIHLNPGTNYGYGGAGHMRMNIATSRKMLELALNNLATALKDLRTSNSVL